MEATGPRENRGLEELHSYSSASNVSTSFPVPLSIQLRLLWIPNCWFPLTRLGMSLHCRTQKTDSTNLLLYPIQSLWKKKTFCSKYFHITENLNLGRFWIEYNVENRPIVGTLFSLLKWFWWSSGQKRNHFLFISYQQLKTGIKQKHKTYSVAIVSLRLRGPVFIHGYFENLKLVEPCMEIINLKQHSVVNIPNWTTSRPTLTLDTRAHRSEREPVAKGRKWTRWNNPLANSVSSLTTTEKTGRVASSGFNLMWWIFSEFNP